MGRARAVRFALNLPDHGPCADVRAMADLARAAEGCVCRSTH